jgi:hypothetical protein
MLEYPQFKDVYIIADNNGRYLGDDEDGAPRYAKSHWGDVLVNHEKWETGSILAHLDDNGKPDYFAVIEAGRRLAYRFLYTEEGWECCLEKLLEIYRWQQKNIGSHIGALMEATTAYKLMHTEPDPSKIPGWLSPSARFYPIGDEDHESYAVNFLGRTSKELEDADWIQTRIIDTDDKPIDLFHLTRFERSVAYVTPSQYEWATKHDVDMKVKEYRISKKYLGKAEGIDNSGD